MKNIYKSGLFLLLCLLAISACDIVARRGKSGAVVDNRTLSESKFDPLGGVGDDEIITSNVPLTRESDTPDNILPPPQPTEVDRRDDQFFSVQLFASKSNSEAKEFKNSISSLFDEDVRIDYQAPYYRVCIGKVNSFEQGEGLLRKVNAMGFPRAWLVRIRK
jgi:hypothetical protein